MRHAPESVFLLGDKPMKKGEAAPKEPPELPDIEDASELVDDYNVEDRFTYNIGNGGTWRLPHRQTEDFD